MTDMLGDKGKLDKKGTMELMELLPVALAIVTGTMIFTASLIQIDVWWEENRDDEKLETKTENLLEEIRTSPLFTKEDGDIPQEKIENLTEEKIENKFPPEKLGFEYMIKIEDKSLYKNKIKYHFQTNDMGGEIHQKNTPITISNREERRAGILTVAIWTSITT